MPRDPTPTDGASMFALARRALLVAGLLGVAALGAAELALRNFETPRPSRAQSIIEWSAGKDGEWSIPDPALGVRARPSRRELVTRHDFAYRIENDAFGFPNREPWPE